MRMDWPLASVLIAAITGLTAAYAIKRLTEPHCYGEDDVPVDLQGPDDEPLTLPDIVGFQAGDFRDATMLLQEIIEDRDE
jgi:hypothetical protein